MSTSPASHAQPARPATAKPTLLFFASETSGPCRRADAYLAHILQRRRNHDAFTISRIDIAKRPDLATRYQITTVPSILIIADHRLRAHIEHPLSRTDIQHALAPWLHH
jgi:thioredoxin-like negative regulator of GroEL